MIFKHPITTALGLFLFVIGLILLATNEQLLCIVPCFVGASLLYIGYKPGRVSLILFGHVCVIAGCFLTTWGIYLLPYCKPKLAHVFGRPLFWGLFAIFGGICALYHGFCRCFSAGRTEECDEQMLKSATQKNSERVHYKE